MILKNTLLFIFPGQDEPFTSYMPEALFNISRFLMHELMVTQPSGISMLYPFLSEYDNRFEKYDGITYMSVR